MPLWNTSGVCSRTNRSITAGMQQGKRLYRTLPSTSRFSCHRADPEGSRAGRMMVDGVIQAKRVKTIGRLGADFYCRMQEIFEDCRFVDIRQMDSIRTKNKLSRFCMFQPERVPRGCTRDEGRSLGAGLQELASNNLKLRW